MSPTCKLKTFHEYEAFIRFKFANKDIGIIKKSSYPENSPPHALCKHNIQIFGEFSFTKGQVSCVTESSNFCVE